MITVEVLTELLYAGVVELEVCKKSVELYFPQVMRQALHKTARVRFRFGVSRTAGQSHQQCTTTAEVNGLKLFFLERINAKTIRVANLHPSRLDEILVAMGHDNDGDTSSSLDEGTECNGRSWSHIANSIKHVRTH